MKISFFLIVVATLQTFALDSYAQAKKIDLKLEKANLVSVLEKIEDESEFFFFYNNHVASIDKEFSLNLKEKTINEILDVLLKDTGIGYTINNRQVILYTVMEEMTEIQEKTISGVVTDASNGETLPGVNVIIQGTQTGTITNTDGTFSIEVTSQEIVLVFSSIGYISQTIKVNGESVLDVRLEPDIQLLDEVIVIGYGTIKKSDLTGSVSSLKGTVISERSTTEISTALQGAAPGLMVSRTSSAPGETGTVRIRGITTLSDNDPLVIVDGIPGDLSQIHPDDVEDITVLKDAASASIYGARAAAGVILITTKRARAKELSLGYSFEYGWEIPTSHPLVVGIQRYLEMTNELKYNDNPSGGYYQGYSEEQVANWAANNITDPDNYPYTDWYKLLVRKAAPRQSHTLTLTGGGESVRTKASVSYDDVEGLFSVADQTYKRYLIRVNNDIKINRFLSATVDFNMKRAATEQPAHANLWYAIRAFGPTYAYQWVNGGLADVKGGNNIYGWLTEGGSESQMLSNLGGKISIDFTPVKGLKFSAIVAPNFATVKGKEFILQAGYTSSDDPNTIVGYFAGHESTSLSEIRNDYNDLTKQFLVNYTAKTGKHDFNLMAGYEDYYYFYESLSASRDQYELTEYPYLNNGPTTYIGNSGSAEENAYRSFFGRLIYSYDDKYLLQANIRYDGSSRFAGDYRWGAFPSVSVGWVVSREPFMKNFSKLSFLKLRASLGSLGNERIGNYLYQSLISFNTSLFYEDASSVSSTYYTAASQDTYAIEDITWETTISLDMGIDARFFDNRLRFAGDYYYKTTQDMLLDLQIPLYLGLDSPEQNTGEMYTRGFDLELEWKDRIGKLDYGISVNLSDFVSKMGYLGGTEFIDDQVTYKGSQYNEWYGYLSDGLFLTQDDVDNSAVMNSNVTVGDVKFRDISGPEGVPDGTISSEYDRVLLGGSLPRYMFGGSLFASYKGFDLTVAFQGVGKQNVRITSAMVTPLPSNWGNIPAIIDGKYWSSFKTEEENAAAAYPRLTYTNNSTNISMSDYWMFNGRYFRMKNITLGYTLPDELTQKISISRARIYVSGNDIFCLSKYPSGWDPERGASSYPITASLLIGASVNF